MYINVSSCHNLKLPARKRHKEPVLKAGLNNSTTNNSLSLSAALGDDSVLPAELLEGMF